MDPETKQLLTEVKSTLAEHTKTKAAVEQLEQQMKGIPQTIENKMKKVRSLAWDRNGRYRGIFPGEDQARSFGLFILNKGAGMGWAGDALKSEFPDVVKAFGTSDAGNLVPEEYSGTIVNLMETYGVFERNALRVPMSTDIQRYSKKTGRMSAVPMAEGNSISETKPTLANKALTARKWGSFVSFPTEVSDDAVAAIGEMIAMDMAEAFALAVDEAGFLGDGTSTYNNISGVIEALISEAIIAGSGDAGDKWSGLVEDDFLKMIAAVTQRTFQGNNAKFFCSAQFYWLVMVPLILAKGGVTAGEMEGRRQFQAFGFPVEITQVLPSTPGDEQIPCVFGNLRAGATLGDRRQLTVKQSEHFMFDDDAIAVLGTRRFDIQVDGAGTGSTVEVLAALQTPDASGG